MRNSTARPRTLRHHERTGSERMQWDATASPASSMELGFPLLLAPAAALLSTLLAALIGGLAGYLGGAWARMAMAVTDIFLSPALVVSADHGAGLDAAECVSVGLGAGDFHVAGAIGLDDRGETLCTTAGSLRGSDFVRQARAAGLPGQRLFWVHVVPNLKPVLYAQFWISIPVFIFSEANLGILGLGVAEPIPSWGSLLKELEGLVSIGEEPWKLVPLILLVLVVTSFQFLLSGREEMAA